MQDSLNETNRRIHDPSSERNRDVLQSKIRDLVGQFKELKRIHERELEQRGIAEEALREQSLTLEVLNQTGHKLVAEQDLKKIVQAVTDGGREISKAAFGAFFYNTT